jgi:hypothetical protein
MIFSQNADQVSHPNKTICRITVLYTFDPYIFAQQMGRQNILDQTVTTIRSAQSTLYFFMIFMDINVMILS